MIPRKNKFLGDFYQVMEKIEDHWDKLQLSNLKNTEEKEIFFLLGEIQESFMSQVVFELGEENKTEIRFL